MNNYQNKEQTKLQKIKICSSNGAHLAKLTEEGFVCPIRIDMSTQRCNYQGQFTRSYTNYCFCNKKSTASKYQTRFQTQNLESVAGGQK